MTAKELAAKLTGREVGGELFPDEERDAEEAGLVVVYGHSDDNVEFSGAINVYWVLPNCGGMDYDEVDTIYLTKTGILEEPDCACFEDCACPYFAAALVKSKAIRAVWHNEGGPCWTFEAEFPHETFTIMEDGQPWCIGIVFHVDDL